MKRILWFIVVLLVPVPVLLLSCASATPSEEKPTTPTEKPVQPSPQPKEQKPTTPTIDTVKWTGKRLDGKAVEKVLEKPKYGGVIIQAQSVAPVSFDETDGHQGLCPTLFFTNEDLTTGDWTRGPTGTGESSWQYADMPPMDLVVPNLAERWEISLPDTFSFHIRKGVRFHNKPPVNGREMTANDVEYSLRRLFLDSPKCNNYIDYGRYIVSIAAPDKWTVTVKVQPGYVEAVFGFMAQHSSMIPREVIDKYGSMKDWRNSAGTGPFMLVDYVSGSSSTFQRNPDYWRNDPFFPENRMPYVDTVKHLIIPDFATRMAAIRTAKVDWLYGVPWEDAETMKKTSPQLKHISFNRGYGDAIHLRVDRSDLPWYDKRVRQALALAVDQPAILRDYWGGRGVLRTHPVMPLPEYEAMYALDSELTPIAREQFEYHPDKAKQLLAEAGFPNGFKASIVTYQGYVDILSIVKDYWAKIGVDLQLDVKEYSVYTSLGFQRKYDMYCYPTSSAVYPYRFFHTKPGAQYNFCCVDDPVPNKAYDDICAAWPDETKRAQILRGITSHLLEQAYILQLPSPDYHTFWQPWIKGYSGETTVGRKEYCWPMYAWVDQGLKEQMIGK